MFFRKLPDIPILKMRCIVTYVLVWYDGIIEKSRKDLFQRGYVLDRVYYTKETSREIYKTADAEMMNNCWLGFHTLDVEMAIEDLKEIYRQKSLL